MTIFFLVIAIIVATAVYHIFVFEDGSDELSIGSRWTETWGDEHIVVVKHYDPEHQVVTYSYDDVQVPILFELPEHMFRSIYAPLFR